MFDFWKGSDRDFTSGKSSTLYCLSLLPWGVGDSRQSAGQPQSELWDRLPPDWCPANGTQRPLLGLWHWGKCWGHTTAWSCTSQCLWAHTEREVPSCPAAQHWKAWIYLQETNIFLQVLVPFWSYYNGLCNHSWEVVCLHLISIHFK